MILNSKYFQFQCFIIPLGYALTSFMDIPPSYPKRLFLVSQACRSQGFRGCYGTTRADLFILLKPDRDHHTKTGPRIFRSSYGPVRFQWPQTPSTQLQYCLKCKEVHVALHKDGQRSDRRERSMNYLQ